MRRAPVAALALAALLAGCGSPPPDLFVVTRSGGDRNANVRLRVSDGGTVTCNGKEHELTRRSCSRRASSRATSRRRPSWGSSSRPGAGRCSPTGSGSSGDGGLRRPLARYAGRFNRVVAFTKDVTEGVCGIIGGEPDPGRAEEGRSMSSAELIAAVKGGDVDSVRALVASDPSLAAATDEQGVPGCCSRSTTGGPTRDALLAAGRGRAAGGGGARRRRGAAPAAPTTRSSSARATPTASRRCTSPRSSAARRRCARSSPPAPTRTPTPRTRSACGRSTPRPRSATRVGAALLEAGADPNAQQQGGYTPLHAAAHHDDAELAGLLLAPRRRRERARRRRAPTRRGRPRTRRARRPALLSP